MKSWKSALALAFAGVLVSTVAFAQAATPSGDQKTPDASEKPKGDSDTTKSGAADMDKADTSGAMKSGTSDTMMKSGKAARGGNRDQVRAAQQALKDKGRDPGMVDGLMGPKTQAALKDFQSKEGLKATGRMDAETMTKLGVEAKTGAAADTGAAASSPAASPKTDTKADTKADSKTDSSASPAAPSSDSSKPGAAAPSATDTTKSDTKK